MLPVVRSVARSPGHVPSSDLALRSEHRRMTRRQHLALPQVHVNTAREARVEAAHRAHDVDAAEILGAVLLENRRILYRVFIRSRSAFDITRARVPRRRRIGMIVGDLPLADHDVMRKHAAYRLMESAGNGFFGYFEVGPRSRLAGMQFR